MAKSIESFWVALIKYCQEYEDPVRLWNGYVGWKLPNKLRGEKARSCLSGPHYVVDAPSDGWPKLTDNEKSLLDQIAAKCGGHPSWSNQPYMDFSGRTFQSEIDFSDLILVAALFSESTFQSDVKFNRTRFFKQSLFKSVNIYGCVNFSDSIFEADAKFDQSEFYDYVFFKNVQFKGGATFFESRFCSRVEFNDSVFSETCSSKSPRAIHLASFKKAEFHGNVSFRKVIFGEDPYQVDESDPLIVVADFSDAQFHAAAKFRHAVFNGAPNFFKCTLHKDTDFSGVKWPESTPTVVRQIDDSFRAWEQLELIMSELGKRLDRHQFYRLKMRTRRRKDGNFLRFLNWLFEATCDYGWSVSRAACWWIGHWSVAAGVLYLNANQAVFHVSGLKLLVAAFGTAFANAHAFLGLAGEGGYLESCRLLIEQNNQFGVVAVVGVLQAVLGPLLLFILLLTLRNRFRLAY